MILATFLGDIKSICSLMGKLQVKCGSVNRKKNSIIFSIQVSIANKIKLSWKHKLSEKKYLFVSNYSERMISCMILSFVLISKFTNRTM